MREARTPDRNFRRKLAVVLLAYATAVVSALAWRVNVPDRAAYVATVTLATIFWVVMSRRGGPKTARDYRSYVWLAVAIAGIALALAVVQLVRGYTVAAVFRGGAAVAFVGLAAIATRLALFIKRLPQLLGGEEEQRAFGIGVSQLRDRRKSVAVVVSDERVIVAVRDGARPRLVAQRDRSAHDDVDVVVTESDAHVTLQADGTTISVLGIPRGQGLRLAAALEVTPG
jgi:hypothetical protein